MTIVELIREQSIKFPDRKSVVFPESLDSQGRYSYRHETFASLERKSSKLALRFKALGIQKGMLTLLFIRPSLEFPVVALALFKLGAVPVMIDPGMGRKNLIRAVEESAPQALIAVDEIHYLKWFFRRGFKHVSISVTTGRWALGATRLEKLMLESASEPATLGDLESCKSGDLAAILFTSGGTGKPKGVCYTHEVFTSQVRLLSHLFDLKPGSSDMPGFPLFALMTIAMGVTSVIPPMNPSKPAQADPRALATVIFEQQVASLGGSPAIWERLATYCLQNNLALASVKSLMMFGAPVSARILENFAKILPNGETYTPYGATECLPVSCIDGTQILTETRTQSDLGRGTCVGRAAPETQIKIIAPSSKGIAKLEDAVELATGEVGEILVKGAQVTAQYFQRPNETLLAKIPDFDGSLWHRMGDLGALDSQQRLWFCGRKAHLVIENGVEYFSVPCEAIFNVHPAVNRCALIALNRSGSSVVKAALVLERFDRRTKNQLSLSEIEQFRNELEQLGFGHKHTRGLGPFYLFPAFPVDPRHNIKIDRKRLGKLMSQNPDNHL